MHDLSDVKPLSDAEAAYIAGFLDADGCITLQVKQRNIKDSRRPVHFHPIVAFSNNRIKVLRWIQNKLGGYGILTENGKSKAQDRAYNLYFSSSVIRWLLPQLVPFLILKRTQAELIVAYCNTTSQVRGGKIKTDMWFNNFKKYFETYLKIRCLNNDVSYGMYFKKSGELLESPESQHDDNVIGNDERERVKNVLDWITSSQAYRKCRELVDGKVQRLESEDAKPINSHIVPDSKEKI